MKRLEKLNRVDIKFSPDEEKDKLIVDAIIFLARCAQPVPRNDVEAYM